MGLFSFVRDAGASIFGADDNPEEKAVVVKTFATRLREHNIDPEGVYFDRKGSHVKVDGEVPDQNTKENIVMILGNVAGIDTVEDLLVVANAAGVSTAADAPATDGADATPDDWQADTYTVQSGDTLGGIAKKLYGNAGKYMVIFEANTPMLKDPNKIYPGQVLRIPAQA
ncbi:MAG: peptidoglycan-binding protein LysM [Lysobacterales bacterium]